MHTYLVLGGYGAMGRITVHDLYKSTRDRIIVAGRDGQAAEKFAASFHSARVGHAIIDVTQTKKLAQLIMRCSIVINCTQYNLNLHVMRACLIAKKSYLDLGGLFHMTKKQLKLDGKFKKRGLTAILGCGSTPGITNILAAYGAQKLDTISEIHIRFADCNFLKSKFSFPYSSETIKDEFTKPAAVFSKGRMKFVQALTGREEEIFPKPVGKVEEFYALHSELATFPSSFAQKGLRECSFKISSPKSFIKAVINIIKNPKKMRGMENMGIAPVAKPNDIEYIRVRMKGTKNGRAEHLTLDCITRSKAQWNAPAGALDTGIPPSIIAQMILAKTIRKKGVLPPEQCVPVKKFFEELKRRGIRIMSH